uniref:Aspartate aminotransferase n=1 Tax=Talaromyces marneffei PM1 TaxID=1077442 RepID=A0A093VIS2_TALMA
MNPSTSPSIFSSITYIPPDAIFELTKKYNADQNALKVNLGQGTYKDENGHPWILPAVHTAKEKIKDSNHEYLPILGLLPFRTLATKLVFGSSAAAVREKRVSSCQALSGTDMASLLNTLNEAAPKSILVLHASAHNPSGWDPSPEQWEVIGKIMKERQLFPIFDAAYLGITSSDYAEDAFAIRYFAEELSLEVAVCLSFAKSMGLYGERIGLCAFVSHSTTAAVAVESALAQLIRVEISNPPAFGARIVAAVLEDESIAAEWSRNLVTMSSRIAEMRRRLFKELDQLDTPGNWERITRQRGMFCILGLSPHQVSLLQGPTLPSLKHFFPYIQINSLFTTIACDRRLVEYLDTVHREQAHPKTFHFWWSSINLPPLLYPDGYSGPSSRVLMERVSK